MATIRKKGSNHQALIRRADYPHQSKTFPTKKLAQAWARDIEHKMDRGIFMDQSLAKTTTLDDLIVRYLIEVTSKKRSLNSIEVDTTTLNRIRRDEQELCSYTLDKLKPSHIEDFRDKRLAMKSPYKRRDDGTLCNMSHSAVKRDLSLLKSVIDHRFIELGLPYNPVSGKYVKMPAVNDKRDVRLSNDEKQRLVNACYKVRNNLIGPFLEIGFETGARRGEILSLLWSDVNLEEHTAFLRDVKNTKNPNVIRNRSIGLSPKAVQVLEQLPHDDERVFPMSANAFRLSFMRVRKSLGMTHFHFHDTRHEFISRMVEAGWDITMIMAQVGHTSTKSLLRYMTIKPTHLAEQLAKLQQGA